MREEKQIKQEIRETWFKNHVATLTEEGNLKVLEWKKPGTNVYYCKFVFDNNMMYISGDIGEAVFELTWKADVHSFNGIYTGYFMEKLQAFSGCRYLYDGEKAGAYLEEWLDENIEEMEFKSEDDKEDFLDTFEELVGDAENCDSEDRWGFGYVNQKYCEFIEKLDINYWEWIYSIGRTPSQRILGYIVALQMASEQLKAKEVNNAKEE